jgi:hypothetical protein
VQRVGGAAATAPAHTICATPSSVPGLESPARGAVWRSDDLRDGTNLSGPWRIGTDGTLRAPAS